MSEASWGKVMRQLPYFVIAIAILDITLTV
jgi:hypothetical protein